MHNVVIAGGGLSGLSAAWQLHRHGVDVHLVEARGRVGGRVLSHRVGDATFDCGPSWIWPGQPHLAALVEHFSLHVYEQTCEGDLLHQLADGTTRRDPILKPMRGSWRIDGGISRLTAALRDTLPEEIVSCGAEVVSVTAVENSVEFRTKNGRCHHGNRAALALPLRLAHRLVISPSLNDASMRKLRSTPTWMAGQAKLFAWYDRPFWREVGLSGDAFSRCGPLAEVHDASNQTGGPYALMGFVGLDASCRQARGANELIEAAKTQLGRLFGQAAAEPLGVHFMDWSAEPYTATEDDLVAPDHHPTYGVDLQIPAQWNDRLDFITSETAIENGGLVEGAVHQGLAFAARVIARAGKQARPFSPQTTGQSRRASMSWDWISPT